MRNNKLKARIFEMFGSQADFASALEINESIISRVIHGRRKLNQGDVKKWCRALKCNQTIFK